MLLYEKKCTCYVYFFYILFHFWIFFSSAFFLSKEKKTKTLWAENLDWHIWEKFSFYETSTFQTFPFPSFFFFIFIFFLLFILRIVLMKFFMQYEMLLVLLPSRRHDQFILYLLLFLKIFFYSKISLHSNFIFRTDEKAVVGSLKQ